MSDLYCVRVGTTWLDSESSTTKTRSARKLFSRRGAYLAAANWEASRVVRVRRVNGSSAAWDNFLAARAACIKWLRDEMENSPEQICETMKMDPGQVRLILAHVDTQTP